MLVEYTRPNLLNVWINPHEAITLKPGINDVPGPKWDEAKKKRGVRRRIDDGVVVELTNGVESSDEQTALAEMRVGEAVEVIKKTFDVNLLKNWLDSDHRAGVTKACRKQIDLIDEQAKPRDKE